LIPALYNLAVGGLLPEPFSLGGVARDDVPSEAFRKQLGATQFATRPVDDVVADRLLACVSYVRGAADDPETYERLQGLRSLLRPAKPLARLALDHARARPDRIAPLAGRQLFSVTLPTPSSSRQDPGCAIVLAVPLPAAPLARAPRGR
jgi:glucose-6-phosphate 1-dehydrogenase